MGHTSIKREQMRLQSVLDEDFPNSELSVTRTRHLPIDDPLDCGVLAICARRLRTGEQTPVLYVPVGYMVCIDISNDYWRDGVRHTLRLILQDPSYASSNSD